MYTVRVTYYDSPREDCSGFYFNDYEFDTPKEAWYFACHKNRQNEPIVASVDLKSGKPRTYSIFLNSSVSSTTEISEFRRQVEFYRKLKLKDGNTRKCISYRFEIV